MGRFPGTSIASLKQRKELIPVWLCIGVGALLSGGYILRLATRSPDVTWFRHSNPEPWQEYETKNYKAVWFMDCTPKMTFRLLKTGNLQKDGQSFAISLQPCATNASSFYQELFDVMSREYIYTSSQVKHSFQTCFVLCVFQLINPTERKIGNDAPKF